MGGNDNEARGGGSAGLLLGLLLGGLVTSLVPFAGALEASEDGAASAVRAALEWLRRHQDADGKWDADGYHKHGENRCEDFERYGKEGGFPEHDVGVTALAMLAFTGSGQTHRRGDAEYAACLLRAVRYLKSVQVESDGPETDGRYGSGDHEWWVYDHAIATLAMSRLLVMTRDTSGLERSVRRAVRLCLRARNERYGWRYGIQPGWNDSSVTGWMVLALMEAKKARLGIPEVEYRRAFEGAMAWFDRATASNGKTGYLVPGDEGSRLARKHADPYPYSKDLSCATAMAVLCRLHGGASRTDDTIRDGVRILVRHPPAWNEQSGRLLSTVNFYYWYLGSSALRHFGGTDRKVWSERMRQALVRTQRRGRTPEAGSWDPIGEWGMVGGRVYSTAIGALTLEVLYPPLRGS